MSDGTDEGILGGYIFQFTPRLVKIKIPEGHEKCPRCKGAGETVRYFRNPGPNVYDRCCECDGKGYVPLKKSSEVHHY
jgi:DnaJ-class molecular chaperone